MFMLRSVGCLALALCVGGCVHTLEMASPQLLPDADEVVLIGEVDFDPAVTPADPPPGVYDPLETFQKIVLSFTDSPWKPVDASQQVPGADFYAGVEFHKPFAIIAPRHTFYLRALRASTRAASKGMQHYGFDSGGRPGFQPDLAVNIEELICSGARKIEPPQDSQYVYIGRIVCHHVPNPKANQPMAVDENRVTVAADERTDWRFENHLKNLRPKLPALIGDHPVTVAIPTESNVTASQTSP
jgi:hypothetical protein